MVKCSCTLLLLLFLIAMVSESVVLVVEGGTCETTIGTCGIGSDDCQRACVAKIPGSEGRCDTLSSPAVCTCYYQCGPATAPPAPERKCNGEAGACGFGCNEDCCNSKCEAKYKNGIGFCVSTFPGYACECKYTCNFTTRM